MTISRRRILGAGAALPLAATTSVLPASAHSGPSAGDWTELDRALHGSVSRPGSASYSSRAQLFDPRWDSRRPAAVARVLLAQDVATCIEFARAHGLKVTGRSGGHSYTGASARTDALVIDTRSMRGVELTPGRTQASIGAGAGLFAVHEALSERERSIPTGTCPTVGVAGLTLVGGIGVDSRRYGLTADRLVRATVVDGAGRIRRVDEETDADLFWALRGGGPGAGIVTSLTYRTIRATAAGFFSLAFPGSSAATVVRRWAAWVAEQPRDTWANAHVETSGSTLSVRVSGVCPAGSQDEKAASLRRAVGVSPTRTRTSSRTHLEGVKHLGGGTTTARTRFVGGSDILEVVTSGAAEAVESAMRAAAARGLRAAAILDPLDGAVSDTRPSETPFRWRAHAASVQWYVGLSSSSGSTTARARAWVGTAHETLGSRAVGGYLGYVESGRALRDYLASNAGRVEGVRRAHDPDGIIV